MAGRKLQPGEIPALAMEYILHGLRNICYGEIILVAQDGVLMQVEWNEKRRLDCWQDAGAGTCPYSPAALQEIAARIRKEFGLLQYGKLVLVIRHGRLLQIERTEKQRFTGLDGEGI
ncbi:YezD family protein [Mitsuokella sp. AF33-22]|uniref:YezD family protein n=1 Tax=Mitsuokella sp. AF33-22 TaxID=2292047 RepID=UPI0013149D20|nr:YezD family protein [Mitsuokella sp. AF33-22]